MDPRITSLSESLVIVLLLIACGSFGLAGLTTAFAIHATILVLFALVVFLARRLRWPGVVSAVAIIIVLMTLYQSLAEPSFVAMGHSFDAQLAHADRLLWAGRDPAFVVAPMVTPRSLEFFSFVYGLFIPYLWLSILLGCIGRENAERSRFVLGLAVTYTLAYLGYLFVPSRGPVEHYSFAAALHGGRFHRMVLDSVVATGGNHGAFPSLHVAASTYLCLFDLRRHPVRGMTYAPIVVLIAASTIVLRYHYVVDILAGLAIAMVASVVAERAAA